MLRGNTLWGPIQVCLAAVALFPHLQTDFSPCPEGLLARLAHSTILCTWSAERLTACLPAGPHIQPGRSNHLARKELQYHLYQHQQLLHGYTDFVARHTHQLLSLALRRPPAPGSSLHHVSVTAAEFEQLGLLLRSSGTEEPSASQQGGSPMDIGPASPFLGGHLVQGVLG